MATQTIIVPASTTDTVVTVDTTISTQPVSPTTTTSTTTKAPVPTTTTSTTSTTSTTTSTTTRPPLPTGNIEGFGAATVGGAGKPVFHVTTLSPTGSGSISSVWGSNRTIVFDVSGTITGWRMPSQGVSFVTIDGTGHPVTFQGTSSNRGTIFAFDGSSFNNIIVRNIRVRGAVGAQDNDGDGINIVNGAHDIALDHVSSSGNNDGNLDITSGANNVTVQKCILGGGLGNGQTSSWWSGTMLIAYSPTRNISVHHNLFAPRTSGGVSERAPYVHSSNGDSTNVLMVDFRNNIVSNWGSYGSGFGYNSGGHFINNYYVSTSNPGGAINPSADPSGGNGSMFYISGNVSGNNSSFPTGRKSSPFPIPSGAQVVTQSACAAAQLVLSDVGCQPLDAVDQALVNSVIISNCGATPPTTTTTSTTTQPGQPTTTTTSTTTQPQSGYVLVYSTGYDTQDDLDPFDHGQLGNGSLSTTIFKTGPGSFKSVPANVSSGTRSEVQYENEQTPLEGIVEYDVYYDNFFSNSGHSLQWHPSTGGGSGTGLYHKNGRLQFVTVKSGTSGTDVGSSFSVSTKTWHHIKLTYKFGSSGYIKVEFDGTVVVPQTNVQMGDGSRPYLKIGINMWVNQTSVVYFDNLKVFRKA